MPLPLFLASGIVTCIIMSIYNTSKQPKRDTAFAKRPPDCREDHTLRPEIAICGIMLKDVSNVTTRLVERGFLIGSCVSDEDSDHCFVSVGLSSELIVKLAVQCALPIVTYDKYSTPQRTFLACQAMDLITRAGFEYTECFLLHRRSDLAEVAISSSDAKISSYFGPSIAVYFTWLKFFSFSLNVPCWLGLILFLYQLFFFSADSLFVPAACLLMSGWSIAFIKNWRQHMATTVFSWESVSSHATAAATWEQPASKFQAIKNAIPGSLLVVVVCVTSLVSSVYAVSMCLGLQKYVVRWIGTVLYISKAPLVLYSLLVPAMEPRLTRVCECIADMEPVQTSSQRYDRLVCISCIVQLVNRFAGLLYLTLWIRDFESVGVVLSCMFVADELRDRLPVSDDSLFTASEGIQSAFVEVYHSAVSYIGSPSAPHNHRNRRHSMTITVERPDVYSPRSYALKGAKSILKSIIGKASDTKQSKKRKLPPTQTAKPTTGQRPAMFRRAAWRKRRKDGDDLDDDSDDEFSAFWNGDRNGSSMSSPESRERAPIGYSRMPLNCGDDDSLSQQSFCTDTNSYESFLYQEGKAPVYDVGASHISKILLYSTVVCFSGVYPLAPLLATLQCSREIGGDLHRLVRCRRPVLDESAWVGNIMEPWMSVMEGINIVGIFVNCFIAFLASRHGHRYVPGGISSMCGEFVSLVLCAVVMEHILLVARGIIGAILPDIPHWVKVKVDQKRQEVNNEQARTRRKLYTEHVSKPVQEISFVHSSNDDTDGGEKIAAAKISALYSNCGWAMTPLFFFGMSLVPCIFMHISMPLFYVSFPITTAICAYVYHMKNRRDWDVVMGIVSDPALVHRVVKDLPVWAQDSGKSQCQWINKLMAQAWKKIGDIAEPKLIAKANDIFSRKKPSFLSSMVMKSASVGTRPPIFSTMEVLDPIPGNSNVQLNLEFNWISDGLITCDVELLGQTLSIDIYNLRFSGTVRVEVVSSDDLDSPMPYKVAKATFMKKPDVDVSVTFGDLDLKKDNSKEVGFGPAIAQVIKQTLATRMLYPKWMQIPLIKGVSEGGMLVETPHGVLTIQILSCSDLEIGDLTTSDPFVEISYLDEVVRTEVIYKNLNPVWSNEYFDFPVYDPACQHIELTVFDYDVGSAPDFLGRADLDLGYMKHGVTKEFDLKLAKVKSGSIRVAVTYFRLQNVHIDSRTVEDILFSLPLSILNEDIITSESLIPVVDYKSNYSILKQSYDFSSYHVDGEDSNSSDVMSCCVQGPSTRKVYGILIISRISCEELKLPIGTTSMRPYLTFTIGPIKRITKVVRGTRNPVYEESVTFVLVENAYEQRVDNLRVKVKSKNNFGGSTILGGVVISLSEVIEFEKQELMVTKALEITGVATGYLSLHLKYIETSNYIDKISS